MDLVECNITIHEALAHAQVLGRLAPSNPQGFDADTIASIGNTKRRLKKKVIASKKKISLASAWGL